MKKIKKSGFTLVEVMLVIVIGIGLAAMIIPRSIDAKRMNEAREEGQKLMELKTSIESMFEYNVDFVGITDKAVQRTFMPSTFTTTGDAANYKVFNIWKKSVDFNVSGTRGYSIEFQGVPTGKVCAEFLKAGRAEQWNKVKVGDKEHAGDKGPMTAIQIGAACNDISKQKSVPIIFTYDPS